MESVSWKYTFNINSKFSTIWMEIVESVFWKDTFSINPIFLKLWKVSRDTFHNSQKMKLYWSCLFHYFKKIEFIETLSTIFIHWRETSLEIISIGFCGIVESVLSRDTFSINLIFWNCRRCLLKRHLWHLLYKLKFLEIVKGVSWRDTFNAY